MKPHDHHLQVSLFVYVQLEYVKYVVVDNLIECEGHCLDPSRTQTFSLVIQ